MSLEQDFGKPPYSSDSAQHDVESQRILIASAQSGDLDALGSLYDSHVNQVYRYTLMRLGNIHDAEDVTGDIFLKMVSGLSNYKWQNAPFAAWLMRISRNEVISFARRAKKRKSDTELPEEIIDNYNVEDKVIKSQEIERLRGAVNLLPEAQREVIMLRFAADLSVNETSRALNKSENNVKVLQHKAVEKLTRILKPFL